MFPKEKVNPAVIIHNEELKAYVKDSYTTEQVKDIWNLLQSKNSLNFPTVEGRGLFKAALSLSEGDDDYTGYDNCWVRDNIHVAHAHYIINKESMAADTVKDIATFWLKYRNRWNDCILGVVDYENDVMTRPHIRFNGTKLEENEQKWSHAQNDAIGYFTWLYAKLANEGFVEEPETDVLVLITLFMLSIKYWENQDNGHWEEAKKVEASSVGAAAAGFRELGLLLNQHPSVLEKFNASFERIAAELDLPTSRIAGEEILSTSPLNIVNYLEFAGTNKLKEILPFESRDTGLERKTDGALLFLVYPLRIVDGYLAETIVNDVIENILGDYGIKRYAGDSYWMANYKSIFSEENRTTDFSDDMDSRDKHFKQGQEAQWCIFDSIISCYYGLKYKEEYNSVSPNHERLQELHNKQILFFNRSVGQVTGEDCSFGPWHCPESYYIENGKYVSNDVCPLLWTQADLINALDQMVDVTNLHANLSNTKPTFKVKIVVKPKKF
ncbi:Six-hairpin glycosidase-like protein [Globomyces pollinis-pini]|nr:Six-hairpin glycosidase-like protein [Globomyces pollinis-pini]